MIQVDCSPHIVQLWSISQDNSIHAVLDKGLMDPLSRTYANHTMDDRNRSKIFFEPSIASRNPMGIIVSGPCRNPNSCYPCWNKKTSFNPLPTMRMIPTMTGTQRGSCPRRRILVGPCFLQNIWIVHPCPRHHPCPYNNNNNNNNKNDSKTRIAIINPWHPCHFHRHPPILPRFRRARLAIP